MIITSLKDADYSSTDVDLPSEATFGAERPDETWVAVNENGAITACASLWFEGPKAPGGAPCATIGHYQATCRDAGPALLTRLCARLAEVGATAVIGPMNGSTWRSYRLTRTSDGTAPFLLETVTPEDWVRDFQVAGFAPVERYGSVEMDNRSSLAANPHLHKDDIFKAGFTLRPFDKKNACTELSTFHDLCIRSFAGNPYYSNISLEDFLGIYEPLVPFMDTRFVLIAEKDGKTVGVVFAYADGSVLIVKTLVINPDVQAAGLGSHLVRTVIDAAQRHGLEKVYFAQMHEDNSSFHWAKQNGKVFRSYELYGRKVQIDG